MAKVSAIFILMITVLLSSLLVANSLKKVTAVARKEDVPFIKCQVCEKIAKELHRQIKKKEDQISPKRVTELQIIDIAENICNLKKEEADWIYRIDIVEKGDRLELLEYDIEGQCNSECKTIERACQEVMGYHDTDVAEFLFKGKTETDLVNFLCKDLTKACFAKPPPVPKDRTPGEAFIPKPSKEAEMAKIMRSMEGMPGAPNMKMYSREELTNMQNFRDDDDAGDDDDDNDDDDRFPSNLGKVLRQKESAMEGWKKKIAKIITTTQATIKKHTNKLGYKIRKWWRGRKKMTPKSPKSKKSEL